MITPDPTLRDYAPTRTLRVQLGDVIGGALALMLLCALLGFVLASFAAADALVAQQPPPDWRPFCAPHECEALLREPPVDVWQGAPL